MIPTTYLDYHTYSLVCMCPHTYTRMYTHKCNFYLNIQFMTHIKNQPMQNSFPNLGVCLTKNVVVSCQHGLWL